MTEPKDDGTIMNGADLIANYDNELGEKIAKLLDGKPMIAICVTLAGQLGSKSAFGLSQEQWDKFQPTLHYLIKEAGDFTIEQLRTLAGTPNTGALN